MKPQRPQEKDTHGRKPGSGGQPLAVDLVVTDRCFSSGLSVTLDVFGTANLLSSALGGPPRLFDSTVRSLDGKPVRSSVGRPIPVDGPIGQGSADIVLVFGPGMADVNQVLVDVEQPTQKQLATYLSAAAGSGAMLGASCSSTFALAEAGVLNGRSATTSWWLAPVFKSRYPTVQLVENELVVATEQTITAGAAFAQIDLALHIVRRFAGAELSHAVARYLIVDDARSAQGPFVMIAHMGRNDRVVTKAEAILRSELNAPLDVESLAQRVGVTPRTLTRHFVAATGLPPAAFLRRMRLEVAAGLLQATNDSIAEIASRVGYEDERAFRRAFAKDMQESPSRFRAAKQ